MLGNTIQHFADDLSVYFDFDFLDRLSIRRKQYHTYLANIKKEQAISMPEHTSVILKELSPRQLPIYDTISKNWNPHLETIFGILTDLFSLFHNSSAPSRLCFIRSTRQVRRPAEQVLYFLLICLFLLILLQRPQCLP